MSSLWLNKDNGSRSLPDKKVPIQNKKKSLGLLKPIKVLSELPSDLAEGHRNMKTSQTEGRRRDGQTTGCQKTSLDLTAKEILKVKIIYACIAIETCFCTHVEKSKK